MYFEVKPFLSWHKFLHFSSSFAAIFKCVSCCLHWVIKLKVFSRYSVLQNSRGVFPFIPVVSEMIRNRFHKRNITLRKIAFNICMVYRYEMCVVCLLLCCKGIIVFQENNYHVNHIIISCFKLKLQL